MKPNARKSNGLNGDSFAVATEHLVDEFRSRRPVRTGSLLITLFGDAIAPHGGTVWLGSLINALAPFGISQRSVRTAIFRLSQDNWLAGEQLGRRSYYRLTSEGRSRFDAATRRIYKEPRRRWSGEWSLVFVAGVDGSRRDAVRRELGWLGFAPFSTNLMAHPDPELDDVRALLRELDPDDKVLLMQARIDDEQRAYLKSLVADAWALGDLGARYRGFLERFRPVLKAAGRDGELDPEHAFRVRTLLIHEYRKIQLRDPELPDALLPGEWDGVAAYQLCRNIYARVTRAAERYLTLHMESADGPLPPAEPKYFERFGGLPASAA